MEQISRFIVGIDLGTTNCAVAYVDIEGDGVIRQFRIPQLVAAGELGERDLLPSFCYVPGEHELPEGAIALPWRKRPRRAVGEFAAEQGAAVPGRLITSAKSWLAHGGVDRTAGILPWGGDLGDHAMSPVAVSQSFIEHIRQAWDSRFGQQRDREGTPCVLAEQQVIVTVPASFDEVARELTVQACRAAGIERMTLLEEPLAAFYAWLWQHHEDWQELIQPGDDVLVVDIGGGTTDFSLINVQEQGTLIRTAVGEHLLLGGDNMDMAIARQVEQDWNTRLPAREWSMLCHQCRQAKETLLGPAAPEEVRIAVAGTGSSLVAGTRSGQVTRQQVLELTESGFFPLVEPNAPLQRLRTGVRQMGLPYAADPAITRHLLRFLTEAAGENVTVNPGKVLFNGGALTPARLRNRILDQLAHWNLDGTGHRSAELVSQDLNLAVSRGAAYYGLVRRGNGVRVKGGIARAYYLEIEASGDQRLLCVMPRSTEEGTVVRIHHRDFMLETNRPVQFPLHHSSTRLGDEAGDVVRNSEEIAPLPPLQTVLQFGKGGQRKLSVRIEAVLNEVGTLELSCVSADGQHRYPLVFNLRGTVSQRPAAGGAERIVDAQNQEAAVRTLQDMFTASNRLTGGYRELENAVGLTRNDWGVSLLRVLADSLLAAADRRRRTAQHEERWLNLTGFCMRPGFGAASDELRMRELWKLWHTGPCYPNQAQVAAEWWIMWRRIAGGLREGHQQQIGAMLLKELTDKAGAVLLKPRKRGAQEAREMWRCIGALERLSIKQKTTLLRKLSELPELPDYVLWVIARLGARMLFHGPENAVVSATDVEPVIRNLTTRAKKCKAHSGLLLFAITNLARKCGVRNLDVNDALRNDAVRVLTDCGAREEWIRLLHDQAQESEEFRVEIIGDSLPLGLQLSES